MFKKFNLGAKNYRVVITKEMSSYLGVAMAPLGKINVSREWNGEVIPAESMEQTAFHEVVHCILDEMARSELNSDETFVQGFALLMHQFFKTMK